MLVETLIQNTLEMQGFRVAEVTFVNGSLEAELVPDRRCAPCCGVCGQRAAYRDTRPVRRFRHVHHLIKFCIFGKDFEKKLAMKADF